MKKVLPGILAALMGGSSAFLLAQFQVGTWLELPQPELTVLLDPSVTPSVLVPRQSPQPSSKPVPDALRVSNQTSKAVRVVLLAQNPNTRQQTAYLEPVHWDFAPSEGSQQGLLLSLPEKNLKLQPGDILVAFALDGSHRYWGPYVVNKTMLPQKSPQKEGQPGEWHLTLQP